MSFLSKIKDIFSSKKEEPQETSIEENKPINEINDNEILNCSLCQLQINKEEKTKELNNNLVHKRCFKKAKKLMFSGKSIEEISKELGNI